MHQKLDYTMERRMTGNCQVRCGAGEISEIISKNYLSLFGTIPRFEELLATMRSMEISANVIIQNLSQLKKMYKDSWENVLGNYDSLLFLGGQEPTTLEHVSKTLGKETIDTRSHNRTRGKNGSTSENDGILGRELMTVDELKVMKDNECILFVRGIYPFFCDKFVIEKHPNYKLLEDSNKDNAYLISDIKTVQYGSCDEQETEDLHSEPIEDSEKQIGNAVTESDMSDRKTSSKDRSQNDLLNNEENLNANRLNEIEQSVTIEDIIGNQVHTFIGAKEFPKDPKQGFAPANLDNTEMVVTAEPNLKPPFIEVTDENYLDSFDVI